MTQHPSLDLERWIREFPLTRLGDEARAFVTKRASELPEAYPTPADIEKHIRLMSPRGEIVVGPHDIAVVEQIRREAFATDAPRNGLATDVFAWARGEPPAPHLTKIGGLPFRSRNERWPRTRDGRTTLFLAQLSFVDSRERFSKRLPGDLLLLFADAGSIREDDLVVEWVRADEPNALRTTDVPAEWLRPALRPEDATPPPHWGNKPLPRSMTDPLAVVHGVIHRTYDYPHSEQRFGGFRSPECLAVIEGTKIGGIPRFVQGASRDADGFLGAIGSVAPRADRRFPWVNVEEPVTQSEAFGEHHLGFGDMGSLYLFRRMFGRVRVELQSY